MGPDPKKPTALKLPLKIKNFPEVNAFENVVCNMVAF